MLIDNTGGDGGQGGGSRYDGGDGGCGNNGGGVYIDSSQTEFVVTFQPSAMIPFG